MNKVLGRDLEFISQINTDGSGTQSIKDEGALQDQEFLVTPLSAADRTYVAGGVDSYIVRLKQRVIIPDRVKLYVFSNINISDAITEKNFDAGATSIENVDAAIEFLTQLKKTY